MADKPNPETLPVDGDIAKLEKWLSALLTSLVRDQQARFMIEGAAALRTLMADPAHMKAVIDATAKRAIEDHAKYIVNRALSDTVYHDAEGAAMIEKTTYAAILRVVQDKLDRLG